MKKLVFLTAGILSALVIIGCDTFPLEEEWVQNMLNESINNNNNNTKPIDSNKINHTSCECALKGAIACFPFNNGSGEDVSGNGNHGKITGALPTDDRLGNPNSALLFDGKDDYVIVEKLRGTIPGNTPKTISGWFNSSKPNKYLQMLFGFGAPATLNNFQIGAGPTTGMDDKYQFRVNGWGDSHDWRTGIPSGMYFDGKWHHCVVTYDGETTKVYFDGELSAQTSQFTYKTPESPSLVIGREIDLAEWEFEGALDDIRIFNWAINEYTVAELYNEK
jgi:hypothetical protein